MNNPEKLATLGTQDKDKQNEKCNAICVGHHQIQNEYKLNKKLTSCDVDQIHLTPRLTLFWSRHFFGLCGSE